MSKSIILSPTTIFSKKKYVCWLWEKQANITSVSLQEPGNVIHNMEAMICFLWGFNFFMYKNIQVWQDTWKPTLKYQLKYS